MTSFLAFLAQDIRDVPKDIQPLDPNLTERIDRLIADVNGSVDEHLGDGLIL